MFVVGGESLIDLVSAPVGPDGVIHMTAHQGGSPYNCARALAKLGNDTGFLCPISRDGFGSYLLGPLLEDGVKPLLPERVFEPTTLAVVTLNAKMEAQYEFYRGAERAYTAREAAQGAAQRISSVLQFGGFVATEAKSAATWVEVAGAALAAGATLTMDPNVRPSLVSDVAAYKRQLDSLIDLAHLVKVSKEDLEWLDPGSSIEEHARSAARAPQLRAGRGHPWRRRIAGLHRERLGHGRYLRRQPVFGDTVGAGDTLMAGIITSSAKRAISSLGG